MPWNVKAHRGLNCARPMVVYHDSQHKGVTMRRMGRSMIMMVVIASCLALDTWVFLVGHLAHAESEVPATSPFSGDEAAIEEGGSWFRAVCAPCHGIRADGRGERGQAANLKKFKKGDNTSPS